MARMKPLAALVSLLLIRSAFPAEPEPVKLVIKPLLCVIDKDATRCAVTFDIRWKSAQPGEYCLNDSVQASPLRCWPLALAGEMKQQREFSEDFRYWLSLPAAESSPPAAGLSTPTAEANSPPAAQTAAAGGQRLSEVKIEVLRVGSNDRRRERRTRHVWDVL
jgi:hypothetical protein